MSQNKRAANEATIAAYAPKHMKKNTTHIIIEETKKPISRMHKDKKSDRMNIKTHVIFTILILIGIIRSIKRQRTIL